MAGPNRIERRRQFPSRAVRRLGWCATLGAIAILFAYVLFGAEPGRLESGRPNPLARVPTLVVVLFVLIAAPFVVALLRRPLVAADHYALSLRPGIGRTLLLPWARIVEIVAYGTPDEPFLLVRCHDRGNGVGDQPRWWDQAVLRAATRAHPSPRRGGATVRAYDVAVRMDEFADGPSARLAMLAAFAPRHVIVADDLDRPEADVTITSPRRPIPMPGPPY